MSLRWLWGAAIYACLVFAAGFVLGALRVLVLAPAVGLWPALAIEAPVMLFVSFLACGLAMRWAGASGGLAGRMGMGAAYLALLMLAEAGLGLGVMSQSPASWQAALLSPYGASGFALQAITAVFPLIARKPT